MKTLSKLSCFLLLATVWAATFLTAISFTFPAVFTHPRSLWSLFLLFFPIGFIDMPLGFLLWFMEYSYIRSIPGVMDIFIVIYWTTVGILHVQFIRHKRWRVFLLISGLLLLSAWRGSMMFR